MRFRTALGKKGFFFVVDVFISIFILSVGLMIILASFISEPDRSQTSLTSRSLTLFMANTTMARYGSDFKTNVLMKYGTDDDSTWPYPETNFIKLYSNSIFDQIGEFYFRETYYGNYDPVDEPDGIPANIRFSTALAEDVVSNIVPMQFEVEIILRNPTDYSYESVTPIYRRNKNPVYPRDETPLLIPSKTIIMGTYDDSKTGNPVIWGPYIIEVHIWQ